MKKFCMNIIARYIALFFFIANLFASFLPMGSLGTSHLLNGRFNQVPENTVAIIPISEENFISSSGAVSKLRNIQSSAARFIPEANRTVFPGLESEKTYPLHNSFFNSPVICYKFSLSTYTAEGWSSPYPLNIHTTKSMPEAEIRSWNEERLSPG